MIDVRNEGRPTETVRGDGSTAPFWRPGDDPLPPNNIFKEPWERCQVHYAGIMPFRITFCWPLRWPPLLLSC